MNIRHLAVTSGAFPTRVEKFEGRDHLVVPVVALVQGVVYASNAPSPEFVSVDAFSKFASVWNGRPIFEGHPSVDGEYVSGNSPEVLASKRVGIVFGAQVKKNKLVMEAWLDIARCEEVAPLLLKRAQIGDPIEISVGAFVDVDEKAQGEYNGKKFLGAWTGLHPDHLALLPVEETGACSRDMGCGVRAAKGADVMYDEFKTLRDVPQAERDKMDEADFAGPNRSFPVSSPEDVAAAAHALGRAKGDRSSIKKKIVAIAYRKGETFVAQLPDAWKREERNATMFGRLMNQIRRVFAQDASETSSNDLMRKLYDALKKVEPTCDYVVDYFPVTDPTHVVYCVSNPVTMDDGYGEYVSYNWTNYERAFTLSDSGVVTLGAARVEVKQVSKYEPVEGASPEVLIGNGNNQYKHDNATGQKGKKGAGGDVAVSNEDAAELTGTLDETDFEFAVEDGIMSEEDASVIQEKLSKGSDLTDTEAEALGEVIDAWADNQETDIAEDDPEEQPARQEHLDKIVKIREKLRTNSRVERLKKFRADKAQAAVGTSSESTSTPEQEDQNMNVQDIVKFLESATECDKKAVQAVLGEPAQVEVKVFDIALAPENVRSAVAAQEAAATEKKNVAIKALKDSGRNKFTDEQLASKTQDELDAMVALVGAPAQETGARAAVDFSGNGTAKVGDDKQEVPAAPDFLGTIRAANAKK